MKVVWAILIGLVVLFILGLGAVLFVPFWTRGLFPALARPGLVVGLALPFLLLRVLGGFVFWALVIGGVLLLVRAFVPGPRVTTDGTVALESPLEILKRRYARGEITKEQFDEMRQTLGV